MVIFRAEETDPNGIAQMATAAMNVLVNPRYFGFIYLKH